MVTLADHREETYTVSQGGRWPTSALVKITVVDEQ